jgi:hypothetical protein
MNNARRLAEQFSNVAMMQSFQQVDRCLLVAFDNDDHDQIAYCAELINELINEVCEYIPAANA